MAAYDEAMITAPSPTASNGNGRDGNGRFAPGNRFANGNPHARRIGQLRSALLEAVTPDDVMAIARKMVEMAKAGDIQAAREVLLRVLGRPQEADLIERLERLEEVALEEGR